LVKRWNRPPPFGQAVWWTGAPWMLQHGALGTQTMVDGRCLVTPVWLPRHATLNTITAEITTNQGVGEEIRIGLYADNGFTPEGGALLEDSGGIDGTSQELKEFDLSPARDLEPGIIWMAMITEGTTGAYRRLSRGQDSFNENSGQDLRGGLYARGGGFGAFTDPCPTITSSLLIPFTYFDLTWRT